MTHVQASTKEEYECRPDWNRKKTSDRLPRYTFRRRSSPQEGRTHRALKNDWLLRDPIADLQAYLSVRTNLHGQKNRRCKSLPELFCNQRKNACPSRALDETELFSSSNKKKRAQIWHPFVPSQKLNWRATSTQQSELFVEHKYLNLQLSFVTLWKSEYE